MVFVVRALASLAACVRAAAGRAGPRCRPQRFYQRRSYRCRDLPIPYRSFYRLPFEQHAAAPINATTWRRKADKAFWRGSTTGGPFLPQSWAERPRAVLVQLCHANPSYCDADFTEFMRSENIPLATQQAMTLELGLAEKVRFEEFFKYR